MTYSESELLERGAVDVPFPNTGIGTRIAAIADLYESRKQAAQAAGVALSTLQRWIAEEGMPAFDSLARLAMGKGVSLDWVATGTGSMYVAAAQAQELEQPRLPAAPQQSDTELYAYIPLYDARCSAGHGAWNERARVLTYLAFTRYSLRKKGLHPERLSCLRADGDSMTGLIDDEDTVMIDESRNVFGGEGVYVILLNDHLYAKRLQREFDGSIRIISHNKEYKDLIVPKERLDELQIIGRAVWAGGWLI